MSIKNKWYKNPANYAYLIPSFFLTAGISAVLLVPVAELNSQELLRQAGMNYSEATLASIDFKTIFTWPFALFYGNYNDELILKLNNYLMEHTYVQGIFGIMLTLLAFIFAGRKRKTELYIFTSAVVIGIFLGLGRHNPLYKFLYDNVYFFSVFRRPSRFAVIFPLFAMYSAAAGFEVVLFLRKKKNLLKHLLQKFRNFFMMFAILSTCYFIAFLAIGERGDLLNTTMLFFSIIFTTGFYYVINHEKAGFMKTEQALFVIAGLSVFLTIAAPFRFVSERFYILNDSYKAKTGFIESLEKSLPAKEARIFYITEPNMTQATGTYNVGGYTPLSLMSYAKFLLTAVRGEYPATTNLQKVSFWGLHSLYLKLDPGILETGRLYRMTGAFFTVYPAEYKPVSNPYPRAWTSGSIKIIPDEECLKQMMSADFIPFNTALISPETGFDDNSAGLEEGMNKNMSGDFYNSLLPEIYRYECNEIEIDVSESRGWLTVSDNWYPGWNAYIDGKKTKVFKSYTTFRTVKLPENAKNLVMKYEPKSVKNGFFITVASLLLSIGLIVVHSRMFNLTSQLTSKTNKSASR